MQFIVTIVCTLELCSGCASLHDLNGEKGTAAIGALHLEQGDPTHDTPPPPMPSGHSRNVRYVYGSPYVLFPFDGTKYLPFCERSIDEAVYWMKWVPDSRVTFIGHTDNRGSATYNRTLGLKRAHFVADNLTAGGIDPSRISVSSLGESEPAVPNTSSGDRALNRRVDIRMEPRLVERME
jgi:outer membrane protein OmpA-like peptidoglycan-associated protein